MKDDKREAYDGRHGCCLWPRISRPDSTAAYDVSYPKETREESCETELKSRHTTPYCCARNTLRRCWLFLARSLRRPSAGRSAIHETLDLDVSGHYSAFAHVTLTREHPRMHTLSYGPRELSCLPRSRKRAVTSPLQHHHPRLSVASADDVYRGRLRVASSTYPS